jgi:hypothetical protein
VRASVVRPRGGVRLFLFLLLTVVPAAPGVAIAQDEPLQALSLSGLSGLSGDNGQLLTLIPIPTSARVELPGGQTVAAALPARATVSSFAALDGGWVAAGSAPDANGGRRLFLLRGDDQANRAAHPLPAPPSQASRSRSGPVLLVDGGRLAGLAWLEGDGERAFSVRSAVWTGTAWQAPERVSFPGPGSQLGLTGAVLADGSWLLAWSAFDGHDDEIVWSRRIGNAWQPVKRLHPDNAVPDITPALAATADGGALIAWSRYDGHGYALRMARFTRGAWQGEHAAGPSGSLYPTFLGAAKLLYLNAGVQGLRGWSVLDLDPQGRAKARASVASALDRPALRFSGGAAEMRWPAEKVSASAPFTAVDRVP